MLLYIAIAVSVIVILQIAQLIRRPATLDATSTFARLDRHAASLHDLIVEEMARLRAEIGKRKE